MNLRVTVSAREAQEVNATVDSLLETTSKQQISEMIKVRLAVAAKRSEETAATTSNFESEGDEDSTPDDFVRRDYG